MSTNIIARCVKGKEYIMGHMIGTHLTQAEWEKVKAANPRLFADSDKVGWRFIPQNETDFSWWDRITQKLTKTKIVPCEFHCDYSGKVTEC